MMQSSKSNKGSGASGASKEGDVKELMWLLDIGFNVREVTKLALQQQRRNQDAR